MECIAVKSAEYLADYRIFVTFSTGESGEVNLQEIVFKYRAAELIRDIESFKDFYLDSWPTLAWSCGFDVSPEYLYELATGKSAYFDLSA